ncbi:hypothetical protein NE237_008714 [Protea cynaroides]|uniref:Uncharacterized protein n=1 Tax=Protea cynaroides TaxID=273540 RepID=A0A9Q0KXA0_9MAGN|nr:hypothetical protein NE237_008714 [Protea cynaroides]
MRERESTITGRRKVFKEREKVAKEKERANKKDKMIDEVEKELERLKEEKSSLQIKLKESKHSILIKINDAVIEEYRDSDELYNYIYDSEQFEPLRNDLGFVASKQALYSDGKEKIQPSNIDGAEAETSAQVKEKSLALDERWESFKRTMILEESSNTREIHFFSAEICKLATVAEFKESNPNISHAMATLIADIEILQLQNEELRKRNDPSPSLKSLSLQLSNMEIENVALKGELKRLNVRYDLQAKTIKDLISEHDAVIVQSVELREGLKSQTST